MAPFFVTNKKFIADSILWTYKDILNGVLVKICPSDTPYKTVQSFLVVAFVVDIVLFMWVLL